MEPQPEPLLELLDLQTHEGGVFRAPSPLGWLPRVFGGQLLAQGLWAASRTLQGLDCHALHANFLRPGEPGQPLDYRVQTLRQGRSLAVCNVSGSQGDSVKLTMTASFERGATQGKQHQQAMPQTLPPEHFGDESARVADMLQRAPAEYREHIVRRWAFEWITVDEFDLREAKPAPAQVRTWMRAREPLPEDRNLHRCALAYASDMVVVDPSLNAIATDFSRPDMQIASLDHAMWFHRFGRADQWLLVVCDSPSVAAGRALNRGAIYDRDGNLLASVAQETLVREAAGV